MERLDPKTTTLLVVDIQEKLAPSMPEAALADVVKNTNLLIEGARILGMNVLASEQYPKGLGPTVGAIKLPVPPFPKLTFDAASDLALARALSTHAPKAVVVVGMEAHICVFQTARELVKRGYATYVVADAVCSRRDENRRLGLELASRAGAFVVPTETVLFDLLERAGSENFKAISKLIR